MKEERESAFIMVFPIFNLFYYMKLEVAQLVVANDGSVQKSKKR